MTCDFEVTDLGDGRWRHQCKRAGCAVVRVVNRPKLVRKCDVFGLGDAVAYVLGTLGIRAKKKCGCKKRQAQLNQIGETVWQGLFGK